MSRNVSIRFTNEVLAIVDSCVEKTKGNRSSFVRDACLAYAEIVNLEEISYVKLNQENSTKLKQLASQFCTDHDEFLNKVLAMMFDQIEKNPYPG